jgi:hypothetical protein
MPRLGRLDWATCARAKGRSLGLAGASRQGPIEPGVERCLAPAEQRQEAACSAPGPWLIAERCRTSRLDRIRGGGWTSRRGGRFLENLASASRHRPYKRMRQGRRRMIFYQLPRPPVVSYVAPFCSSLTSYFALLLPPRARRQSLARRYSPP